MVMARLIVPVLSAIACFTVVATPAHAGGGMGAGSGATLCRLILNGAPNQPQTVKVGDTFLGSGVDQVKVGAAVLLCDLAVLNGSTVSGPPTGNPVPESEATSTTCYSISGADAARIGATMTDPFTEVNPPGTQAVEIGAIQLLCVPSVIAPS
jgi:hypothetical protein